MKTHWKLMSQERDKIAYWHAIGESMREIARRLDRSPSSICSELKRNKVAGIYHSIHAHKATEARKLQSHKKIFTQNPPIIERVPKFINMI
jgi:IS30 family transposase